MKRKNTSKKLTHDELKDVGRQMLLDRGFDISEIKEEYEVEVANNKHYRIDIAAVREGRVIIAIECGQLKHEKAIVLSEIAGELIQIPYHYKLIDNMDLDYAVLKRENEHLKELLKQKEAEKKAINIEILEKQGEIGFTDKQTKYIRAKAGIKTEEPEYLIKLKELTEKVEYIKPINRALPGWCGILDGLIAEIAKKREQDPEEFKQSLLSKIREKDAFESQGIHVITRQSEEDCEKEDCEE